MNNQLKNNNFILFNAIFSAWATEGNGGSRTGKLVKATENKTGSPRAPCLLR
jgi:hypothetical protein